MATAKNGLMNKALKSAPVKAIKKAAAVVADTIMDPPTAINSPVTVRRPSTKKVAKKAPAKKGGAKTMDRKLVAVMEDYEVKYLAQKHKVTQKAVKEAVSKVGPSRNKVEAELKRPK